jgi:hypothetical protein
MGLLKRKQLTHILTIYTTRSHDLMWYILCILWVDQLKSNIWYPSWTTLYLFFSINYDVVLKVQCSHKIPQDMHAIGSNLSLWPLYSFTKIITWSRLYLTHALMESLKIHRQFFSWEHAPRNDQPWLNLWDHHDLVWNHNVNASLHIVILWSWSSMVEHIN